MRSSLLIERAKLLTLGLNNLRVIDLDLLRRSYMSVNVTGINLLLEGLSEPSVECKYSTCGYRQWLCSRRFQQDIHGRKHFGWSVFR